MIYTKPGSKQLWDNKAIGLQFLFELLAFCLQNKDK